MTADDPRRTRKRALESKGELTAMERGELRALRQALPAADPGVTAEERAAELLARPTLTPAERGQLRAVAMGLPAYERRQVQRYLNELATPP